MPLGEACEINPKQNGAERLAPSAEVSFVPMAAVDESSGTIVGAENRALGDISGSYTPIRDGDVLFAKITPCMENGKAAIARGLANGCGFGSTEFHVLRCRSAVLPQWIFAFVRQPWFREVAKANFTGTAGQQRVPADFLRTVAVPVPPLPDQERMVRILEEAEALRSLRTEADHRMPAVSQALFGYLLARNEGEWRKARLEDLCSAVEDCPHSTPAYSATETPYPCVRSSDIQEGRFDWSTTKYVDESEYKERVRRLVPQCGDVVYCREGARLGNAAIIPDGVTLCLGQRMMLFRPAPGTATAEVIWALLHSELIRQQVESLVGGAASPHLNVHHIKVFSVVVPPYGSQIEFTSQVQKIRALEAAQADSRERLDDLFQSLLHRAFQGEL